MSDIITFTEKLGKGGYGSVYKCKNGLNEISAVKKIKNDELGIACLMEISIMMSFNHPYLNVAKHIHTDSEYIYIFMDLADSDLDCLKLYPQSSLKSTDPIKKLPSIEQIRKWSFQLLEAVHCLHGENIIHCDIKAANVLRFGDDVKLSDFTLAIKKWYPTIKYRHNICTCTHRPLEVLLQREWDESVDIWALGCTLYEIAYGELLFPYQGNGETVETKIIRDKFINCIADWAERYSGQQISISRRPTEFVLYHENNLAKQPEYKEFNDFLSLMLKVDPKERASTIQLLQHPFLQNIKLSPYTITRPNITPLPESDIILFETTANSTLKDTKISHEKIVIDLAREIFKRCGKLSIVSKNLRAMACLHIASKLVSRTPLELGSLKKKILEVEQIICANLSFRFCLPNN